MDVIHDISESGLNTETYAVSINHRLLIAYELTETWLVWRWSLPATTAASHSA